MQELQALVRGASQLAGSEGPDQQVLHVLQKSTSWLRSSPAFGSF